MFRRLFCFALFLFLLSSLKADDFRIFLREGEDDSNSPICVTLSTSIFGYTDWGQNTYLWRVQVAPGYGIPSNSEYKWTNLELSGYQQFKVSAVSSYGYNNRYLLQNLTDTNGVAFDNTNLSTVWEKYHITIPQMVDAYVKYISRGLGDRVEGYDGTTGCIEWVGRVYDVDTYTQDIDVRYVIGNTPAAGDIIRIYRTGIWDQNAGDRAAYLDGETNKFKIADNLIPRHGLTRRYFHRTEWNKTNSLAYHYPLNDNAANSTVIDSTGNSNGTYNGPTSSAQNTETGSGDGKILRGLNFDSSNSENINTNTSMADVFSDSFTVSFWVKFTDGQGDDNMHIMGTVDTVGGTGDDRFWVRKEDNGGFLWQYRVDGTYEQFDSKDVIFPDGATDWYHIVLTGDANLGDHGGMRTYINGMEIKPRYADDNNGDTSGITFSNFNPDVDFGLGDVYVNGSTYDIIELDGALDDVRFYTKILSRGEINALYQSKQAYHYKLNDDGNSIIEDNESNSNGTYTDAGGTENTSAGSTKGKIKKSLDFDSANSEYVSTSIDSEKIFGTTSGGYQDDFSVSFWMKPDDGQPASDQTIFGVTDTIDGDGEDSFFIELESDGALYCYIATNFSTIESAWEDTGAIFANGAIGWQHVTISVDYEAASQVEFYIYVNGEEVTGNTTNDGGGVDATEWDNLNAIQSPYIGNRNVDGSPAAGEYYNGLLDDFRVFEHLVTEGEAKALYNFGRGTEDDIPEYLLRLLGSTTCGYQTGNVSSSEKVYATLGAQSDDNHILHIIPANITQPFIQDSFNARYHYPLNDNAALPLVIEFTNTDINAYHYDAAGLENTANTTADGKIGYALHLDSTNDEYIDTQLPMADIWSNDFSVAFWAKPDDGMPAAVQIICGVYDTGGAGYDQYYSAIATNGRFYTYYKTNWTANQDITFSSDSAVFSNGANDWSHFVLRFHNGATPYFDLYQNGEEVATTNAYGGGTVDAMEFDNTLPLFIGTINNNGPANTTNDFDGRIDDFRVFDRVIIEGEIIGLYNFGHGTEKR